MTERDRRIITVVAVGHAGDWVVCTPDGRVHRGNTRREAMAAAIVSEEDRRARHRLAEVR